MKKIPAMTEEKLPGIRLLLPHSARKARHTVQITPHPYSLKIWLAFLSTTKEWDEFVSQLTVDQAYEMMAATRFQFNAQDAVGSPVGGHSDGPLGITGAWV